MTRTRRNRPAYKTILLAFACVVTTLMTAGSASAQEGPQVPITLSQAIDLALKQNRTLRLAGLSVADSEHKREIARSAYFPKISNQSAVRHITELAGVRIPAGAFGVPAATGPIPAETLFIDQGASTSYTSGTELAQPFTQMFKIHEFNRVARAEVDTAKIQLSQAENEIALKVRELYCGLLVAQLKLQAAREEVSASGVRNREDADAVANGRALEVTVLESQASSLEAQQAVLVQTLSMHQLMVSLDDVLGLSLNTKLQLDADPSAVTLSVPTREECLRVAQERSTTILAAREAVLKAKAALGAAKDSYIPDVTGLARYSYQSGVPLLVHNFGSFGFSLTYDLFDGGRRNAEIKDARIQLTEAQVNLDKAVDEAEVAIESAYDKVEQSENLVKVIQQALDLRTEVARLADRQFEQNAALASTRAEAHARLTSARASLIQTTLALSIAQGDLKRIIGQLPR